MRPGLFPALPLLLLVAATPAYAQRGEFTAARSATVDAAGARRIEVRAAAGSLRIVGQSGVRAAVRAQGTARTNRERYLQDIRLRADRDGDVVTIEVEMPEAHGITNLQAALDLEISVPRGIPLRIDDSSGSIEIRNVAAIDIEDSSGDIELEDIDGSVTIDDSSGNIDVDGVAGDVRINDGSGSIRLRDIRGGVTVEDGSGEILIEGVTRNVRITDDGSGDIVVADVGGDLTVDEKGSGRIRHRGVRGRVRLPRDSR